MVKENTKFFCASKEKTDLEVNVLNSTNLLIGFEITDEKKGSSKICFDKKTALKLAEKIISEINKMNEL